jgi:replicative DNA helicase
MITTEIMLLEKSLIASILRNPDTFKDLKKHLVPDMFSTPLYRKALIGLHACAERGAELDAVCIQTFTKMNSDELMEVSELLTDNSVGGYGPELFRRLLNARLRHKASAGLKQISGAIETGNDAFEIIDDIHTLHTELNAEIFSHISKSRGDKVNEYRGRLNAATYTGEVIPTPFTTFNAMTEGGLRPGDYVLIGGRAGSGKSSFMLAVALHAAKCGKKTAYLSGEMPIAECFDRLAGMFTGFNISDIRAGKENARMDKFFRFMDTAPLEIFEAYENSVEELTREVSALLYNKYDIILVDYLQKYSYSPKAKDEFQEIQKVSGILRNYALRSNVVFVVASSMNRLEAKNEKMTLHSFYGSSKLGHDGTIGLILDAELNDEMEMRTGERAVVLTVAKNRNGARGEINLQFELRSQRMHEKGFPTWAGEMNKRLAI